MSTKFGLSFIDTDISDYVADPTVAVHTYDDFKLRMISMYIPMPEPKVQTVDLPFSNGSVDLTEAAGTTPYSDRKGLSFEFAYFGDLMDWPLMTHKIANFLHGKKILMIPDNDPSYYYVVRLDLDSQKSSKIACKVVLSGSAEPFKYTLIATNEPWLWDPFRFPDGQIISTSDIVVNGTTNVTIPAGGVLTSPSFIVTQAGAGLGVVYNTKPPRTLYMSATGTYRFPQIKAGGDTATTITLVGQGRVSIAYRSKYL